MIQNVLRGIGGVGNYGAISISLFFLVFAGAMIWAFSLKKNYLKTMESLPLQDDEPASPKKGKDCHE